MKKRLALLLGVLFILVAAFASCGQAAATDKRPRWATNESYTFNISLPDFADDENSSALFNNYTKTFTQNGEDGKTTTTTLTCYKDDVVNTSEAAILRSSDQVRPVDVNGTYTLTVQEETTSTWKAVIHQSIYCQYETAKLQELGCLEFFEKSNLNVTAKEENPFENNEGRITLKSETDSSVIFANDEEQLPVSSATKNDGFYIGKLAQTESHYEYKTVYDIANKKVTVTKGSETEERSLNLGNATKCIDANQLLLYIRSLDKSDAAFQDTPSVLVYDVTADSLSTATFSLNRQLNLKIDNADLSETIVTVNAVNVTIGGIPYIAQYNLPDVTAIGDGYDYLPISGSKRSKYTTIKFRCGWFSYELQPDDEYKQTLDAIKVKVN